MNDFINRRLNTLAYNFFDLDCERENLLHKLEQLNERILQLKSSIQFSAGYPNDRLVYDLNGLVLEISSMDINVYTNDQYEKAFPLEEDYIEQ